MDSDDILYKLWDDDLLPGEQRAGSEEITYMVQKMTMAQTRFWGGLRIYITGNTDKIWKVTEEYEGKRGIKMILKI